MDTCIDRQDADLPALIGGGRLATPDLRLRRAILEDALRVVFEEPAVGRRARAIRDDTKRWIFEDDLRWPYSFRNVCRALMVDAALLRRRVRVHDARRSTLHQAA